MSGGGGGGVQRSTSTVTQSNLPEYARPYFERLMSRGEAQSLEDYIPYTGARIASTPADILASEQLARDVSSAPTPGFDTAYQSFGRQAQGTSPFRSGIAEIFDPSMTMGRYQDPYTANVSRMYDPRQQVGSYMNPYLENVLDVQQRRAQERFDEGQAGRDSQAVSAGAFGGSRRAVADRLARQDLDLRLSDMESQALSSGYSDAMARAEAQQKLQTGLSQQLFSNAQAAAKEQQAMRIAALEKEASLGMDAAQRAATLDPAFQQYGLERVRTLAGAGEAARGRDKESLDLAYGDFINQRDFPRQNLQFLGSLLRGVPITASSEVNQYKPSPSPYNALLALGLGAVNPFG